MNRLPRPGSKTERVARRRVMSLAQEVHYPYVFLETYLHELREGAPLTVEDMRPVWRARRARRALGRERAKAKRHVVWFPPLYRCPKLALQWKDILNA